MAKTRRDQLAEQLTVKQQQAVYALLDNEMLPYKERKTQDQLADELEVNRATLYRWRKQNQAFIEFKKEVAKDYLGDEVGLFADALIQPMRCTNGVASQNALSLHAKMMCFNNHEHSAEVKTGYA